MTEEARIRLDMAVLDKVEGISRASAEKLIKTGLVKVNKTVITKPAFKVGPKDKLKIDYDFDEDVKIEKIDIPVIYEDDNVVVINKPEGLLTHSKGQFNPEPTVATWLADRYTGQKDERAGIVHRLDRLTSGVMICAKNEASAKWLQKQFSTRKVKKSYVAIVTGHMHLPKALIDLPIERNPKSPQSFRVGATGKSAQTEYLVLEETSNYSLLKLQPTTGRTHQLRVHLSHLNHPIVGDSFYGGKPANRMYLHAETLELTLPDKTRKIFEVKTPKLFNTFLQQ